jgi:hypothetical protein
MFITALTGVDPLEIQRWILPFAMVGVPLVFWILVHEITQSAAASTLGTIFLMLQPELQFVLVRGSHEKFGRLFMILSLYLLFKTLKKSNPINKTLYLILFFYLTLFAYLSSNFLIGFSFIAALGFALLCGWVLSRLLPGAIKSVSSNEKLVSVSALVLILAYFIAFYAYPPVQNTIVVADNLISRVQLLFLNPGSSVNVYQKAFTAWGSPLHYITFNLANWLVLLVSFAIWIKAGVSFLWANTAHGEKDSMRWLLWLLYGAFGFQALLSIISDASGMFGNLQHRIFPSLSILGVLIISVWLSDQKLLKKPVVIAMPVAVFLLAILSTLKFTNEPTLVGWWMFFTNEEHAALDWASERIFDTSLWVGYNERLYELNRQEEIFNEKITSIDIREVNDNTSYILISTPIINQSAKFHFQLPDTMQKLHVYDNGDASIYKRRPSSPYQK